MEREEQRRKEQEQIRQDLYLEKQEEMERKKEMVSAGRYMKGFFYTLWISKSAVLFVTLGCVWGTPWAPFGLSYLKAKGLILIWF